MLRPIVVVVAALGVACVHAPAELIATGGKIWVGDGSSRGAEPTALAVRGGRVVALGDDATVVALAGPHTARIDLAGRRVVPGFIDNHTHFIAGGLALGGVDLRDATTRDELIRRLAAHAREHPGRWILDGNWDHELWGGELPRRQWIDAGTGETPVFVVRTDGHMGLANSRALALAGIDRATPDPPGGVIVRDADGEPTGVLKDAAIELVLKVVPPPDEVMLDAALDAAQAYALARGVTLVNDIGPWTHLDTHTRARRDGRLKLRVYSVVPISDWPRLRDHVAARGRGDLRHGWGAVKGFVDGSMGSSTAWFHEPYTDAPGSSGLPVTDLDRLRRDIAGADAARLHVVVHAIGDRAIDWLLDAFAAVAAQNGARDRRFRIEHAQHPRPDAIRRIARDGVVASAQPYHLVDDGPWAEKRIGARIAYTYPFRSLLDAGARVTFGSDFFVAPMDPLLGIWAATTRRTARVDHPDGWVPEQKITVVEALTAYTSANAWATFRDADLGTLAPGKLADFVVLGRDLLVTPPAELDRVPVDLTVIDGEVVFRRDVSPANGAAR